MICWNNGIENLHSQFKSLPLSERAAIINRMIFYKSCYGTPTGKSEKGLFEVVASKHILNR